LLINGHFYTPWSWLPRIVMQFTAGALACAAVRKLRPTHGARVAAGVVAAALIVATVGLLYLFDGHPLPGVIDSAGVVDVFFAPLVVALAIGVGTLPRLLATRLMVLGGQVSFCLYMVHELVHTVWSWAAEQFGLPLHGTGGKLIVAGLMALSLGASVLLYRTVEEPARKWMRSMIDTRTPDPPEPGVAAAPRQAVSVR
jgi:peptidoglycan/LPS O-acetylase OafA/YrhL